MSTTKSLETFWEDAGNIFHDSYVQLMVDLQPRMKMIMKEFAHFVPGKNIGSTDRR